VDLLISEGLDTAYVGAGYAGITDKEVIQTAKKENRIIITLDRDYGELVFRHGLKPVAGVIYLRLNEYEPDLPARLILGIIKDSKLTFSGKFTVIDHNGIRQRNL
jgi:predicted nuclease of predicted toxin-antitoxin system